MMKPNILVLDIETMPAVSFHWKSWDENISMDQMREPSRVYSCGMHWLDTSEWLYAEASTPVLEPAMYEFVHREMAKADAIVTYNGDKFDLPRLTSGFIDHNLPALGKLTSIDCIKFIRTLKLPYNSLAYALQHYKLGKKVKTDGFQLWRDVYFGDEKARKKMQRYCMGDVRGLANLYKRIRGHIKNHPDLSGGTGCPVCLSDRALPMDPRYTKLYTIEKRACCDCDHVYDATKRRTRK